MDAPAAPGLVATAQARGIPLAVLLVTKAEALAAYEGWPLVLVRPDPHVAWRGQAEPAHVQALWDQLTGAALGAAALRRPALALPATGLDAPTGLRVRRHTPVLAGARRMHAIEGAAAEPRLMFAAGLATRMGAATAPAGFAHLTHLPDGRLLVVDSAQQRLWRAEAGFLKPYADVSALGCLSLGALVLERSGRIYLAAQLGVDEAGIIAIERDASARIVLRALSPGSGQQGLAITPEATPCCWPMGKRRGCCKRGRRPMAAWAACAVPAPT